MNAILELTITNLTSPIILFFCLGLFFSYIKANVQIPSAISDFMTLYLLITIGFKGGVSVAETGLQFQIILMILAALALGVIIPYYSYYVLRHLMKFKYYDAAAIAGHYGSVSVVTFIAGITFLNNSNISYESYINGIPALMEVPAVIVALLIASRAKQKESKNINLERNDSLSKTAKQVILSKSVVLLLGGLVVGFISGPEGMEKVSSLYKDLFMGVLSLFMLEMGMIAALKVGELKNNFFNLLLLGTLFPVANSILGILAGNIIGLSLGGTMLLGLLAASSSYIVAPATMRVSLPKANPAFYLGASLGITLPFNLTIGIPLYYSFALFAQQLF